jgi:hypothetical protein
VAALPLEGVVDLAAEVARLRKEDGKLVGEIAKIEPFQPRQRLAHLGEAGRGGLAALALLLDHLLLRPMRSRYDGETDALYLRFAEAAIVESEEIRPGVVLKGRASGLRFSQATIIDRRAA